jgi:hypothetical protein
MADSIEQRIIDLVVARMQTIDCTGDMLTDVGERVEDSRPNWDDTELPAISVFEGTVETVQTDDELIEVYRSIPIQIRCFTKRQDTAAEDAAFARKAISDIYRAIKTDPLWKEDGTALAYTTREKDHGIIYPEDSFEITGVQVSIEVLYFAEFFNMES